MKTLAEQFHDIAQEQLRRDGAILCKDIIDECRIAASNGHMCSTKPYDINSVKQECLRALGFELKSYIDGSNSFLGFTIHW